MKDERSGKHGYRRAVARSKQVAKIAEELQILSDLRGELARRVDGIEDMCVSRQEMLEDLGFSRTGLRLLERAGWLKPEAHNGNVRKSYSMRAAMSALAYFPGFCQCPTARTRRKSQNITSVVRDVFHRRVGDNG